MDPFAGWLAEAGQPDAVPPTTLPDTGTTLDRPDTHAKGPGEPSLSLPGEPGAGTGALRDRLMNKEVVSASEPKVGGLGVRGDSVLAFHPNP